MKNLVFLIFICCAIACEQKKPSGTTSQEETINFQFEKTPALYNCLKAQLENGISVLVDGSFDAELYKYGKNDLEVTFPLVKEILQKKGYQFPAEQETLNYLLLSCMCKSKTLVRSKSTTIEMTSR